MTDIITAAAIAIMMIIIYTVSAQLYHDCSTDREVAREMRTCMETGARYDDCRYWVLGSTRAAPQGEEK